jgi:hypothetical protein
MASIVSGSMPLGGSTGRPFFSSTPSTMYPPPRLWKSFAKAQTVCSTLSGFQPALYSTRSPSMVRCSRRAVRLMGRGLEVCICAQCFAVGAHSSRQSDERRSRLAAPGSMAASSTFVKQKRQPRVPAFNGYRGAFKESSVPQVSFSAGRSRSSSPSTPPAIPSSPGSLSSKTSGTGVSVLTAARDAGSADRKIDGDPLRVVRGGEPAGP